MAGSAWIRRTAGELFCWFSSGRPALPLPRELLFSSQLTETNELARMGNEKLRTAREISEDFSGCDEFQLT